MSMTAGSPLSFQGVVTQSNDHNILVRSTDGNEALIPRAGIKDNASRPCFIGTTGTVKLTEEGIVFTPVRKD